MEITTEILQKIRASKPNTPEVLRDKYIELTKQGIEFLIGQNVKLIVIACGTATSQALEEVKKIYCGKCGKEINDKAKFCRHCGSPVKHNEAEEQKKENDFEGILTTIYSGTIFRSINAEMENPAGKENAKIVNDIKFEGIERVGKNNFAKSSIYINHVIDDVKKIIQSFEIQFENQFKDIDTSERHVSDLILQFKIKEIE